MRPYLPLCTNSEKYARAKHNVSCSPLKLRRSIHSSGIETKICRIGMGFLAPHNISWRIRK